MEELRGRKYTLGPKGFKTIIKSKCQVARGHCLYRRKLGEGNIPQILSCPQWWESAYSAVKGKPSLKFSTPNLKSIKKKKKKLTNVKSGVISGNVVCKKLCS